MKFLQLASHRDVVGEVLPELSRYIRLGDPLPRGRGGIHHTLAVVLSRGGGHDSRPHGALPTETGHGARFLCMPSIFQVLDIPVSLDEHPRKFLAASAPTDPSDTAQALVQQDLQPILLKLQRVNPSGGCQGYDMARGPYFEGLRRAGNLRHPSTAANVVCLESTPPMLGQRAIQKRRPDGNRASASLHSQSRHDFHKFI